MRIDVDRGPRPDGLLRKQVPCVVQGDAHGEEVVGVGYRLARSRSRVHLVAVGLKAVGSADQHSGEAGSKAVTARCLKLHMEEPGLPIHAMSQYVRKQEISALPS